MATVREKEIKTKSLSSDAGYTDPMYLQPNEPYRVSIVFAGGASGSIQVLQDLNDGFGFRAIDDGMGANTFTASAEREGFSGCSMAIKAGALSTVTGTITISVCK